MSGTRTQKAKLDDFQVKRNGEGKIIPVEQETEFGVVKVTSMTYGETEEMSEAKELSTKELAKLFSKHIVDPDLSGLVEDDLKNNFKPLAIQELLLAIMRASGLEKKMTATIGEGGTARIDTKKE